MVLPPDRGRRFAAVAVVFELGLGLGAVLIGLAVGHDPLAPAGAAGAAGAARITAAADAVRYPVLILVSTVATLPPLVFFLYFLRSRRPSLQRIRIVLVGVLDPLLRGMTVARSFIVALAAGIGEEVLFRGLLLGGLIALIGPVPALIVSSLVFGALHWITHTYAAFATVIGLYLGGLYLLTGTLLVPVLVHVFYDAAALILLSRRAVVDRQA